MVAYLLLILPLQQQVNIFSEFLLKNVQTATHEIESAMSILKETTVFTILCSVDLREDVLSWDTVLTSPVPKMIYIKYLWKSRRSWDCLNPC